MLALHIPEEDRCIDILELIEQEKLLRYLAFLVMHFIFRLVQDNLLLICHFP